MLVKDYRGKNAEQEIWTFDAVLVAQINDVLKHVDAGSEVRNGTGMPVSTPGPTLHLALEKRLGEAPIPRHRFGRNLEHRSRFVHA
jgi:hypothetical protein